MKVKVKLEHPDAKLPTKAHKSDAGFDLYSTEEYTFYSSLIEGSHFAQSHLFNCGFKIEIPEGYEGQIRPRSGLASKHGITVTNSPGTIDSSYRGPIKVSLTRIATRHDAHTIEIGDRIAQLVIKKLPEIELVEVDSLSDSDRGEGGFGSTGE